VKSPITAYRQLFVTNARLVVFSFLMAVYSSFGQTYFIGVFGPQIQAEFGLSHTLWGSIYLAGTLTSALLMPFTGALIDRFSLSGYALAVGLALLAACAYISVVAGPITLVLAIFLLRHSGQGLASHVSITSMARYFDRDRGRAIAVASLGYSVGEAVLPFLAVVLIAVVGWRWTYGSAAILIGMTLIPATLWLLSNHGRFHRQYLKQLSSAEGPATGNTVSWTRGQVLRDLRFYVMSPGILSSSLIGTAFFFHHLNVAHAKGWSGEWITGTYIFYALAGVITLLLAGPLIDRFRAVRVIQVMLIPLAAGCFMLAVADHAFWVIPYMLMLGVHTGLIHTSVSALWAELYGTRHLGAIKSLYLALMVLASALGPVIMGVLMDAGLSIYRVCSIFGIFASVGALLIVAAMRMRPNMPSDQST
jgi:MFS family permease|tara:strand:- start:317 stop:1576 length:1260 start_codon:yes stop_codon:yes gene_type:complete